MPNHRHNLAVAAAQHKRTMREAYIELDGIVSVWKAIDPTVERRDFYGDIIVEAATDYIDSEIKVLITHHEIVSMSDNFISGITESKKRFPDKEYTGRVKYSVDVKVGDLILVPYSFSDIIVDGIADDTQDKVMPFRVVSVNIGMHAYPISKKLTMKFHY